MDLSSSRKTNKNDSRTPQMGTPRKNLLFALSSSPQTNSKNVTSYFQMFIIEQVNEIEMEPNALSLPPSCER